MAKVKFKVTCTAVYDSELEIPINIVHDEKAVLDYVHEHLPECPVLDITFLNDLEPDDAVTAEDIQYIEYCNEMCEQIRATNIKWNIDEDSDGNNLPTTVMIPDEYVYDAQYTEETLAEVVSDWLSDRYDFCHEGFELLRLTDDDLKREEEMLKRAVHNAGVNAIEEFLGHILDSDDIDIESEMNDVIAQMPDEEYLIYLTRYSII